MRRLTAILFMALLIMGCGKKNAPVESTGPAVSTAPARVVLVRTTPKGPTDSVAFRGVISITNNRAVDIVLTKAEFSAWVGGVQKATESKELGFSLAAGSTTELTLDTSITWPSEKVISASRGKVMGTLYYRTPNGNIHQLAFDHGSNLTIKE